MDIELKLDKSKIARETVILLLQPLTVLKAEKTVCWPWGMGIRMIHSTENPMTRNSKGEIKAGQRKYKLCAEKEIHKNRKIINGQKK